MGSVLALGFLANAAIDVVVGFRLQRFMRNPRAAGRLQLVGSVACSLSLVLVFLGAWLPVELRFAYSLAIGIAFRVSYALYDIPQNALMALATSNTASRLRLASARIWFSGVAILIVASAIGPLIGAHVNSGRPDFLFVLASAFAIVAIPSAWLLNCLLRHATQSPGEVHKGSGPSEPMSRAFWLLLFVMFASSLLTPLFSKLEPYFATYVLRSPWWGGAIVIAMAVGIMAGQPVWPRVCRHRSHGMAMVITASIQITGLAAFLLIGGNHPGYSTVAAFVFGLGNGGVGMVYWAAFSEVVARRGSASAASSYGLFTATAKIAQAGGGLLLGLALTKIDFQGEGSAMLTPLMVTLAGLGAVLVAIAGFLLHREVARASPCQSR